MRCRSQSGSTIALYIALLLFWCLYTKGIAQENGIAIVRGSKSVAQTDDNYVCATIDWWPPEKCNYGQCPWGNASILNLDIRHPLLAKAVQAFQSLRIRVGGSLQDQVVYEEPDLGYSCRPFKRKKGGLFGFSEGCLGRNRWDAINLFFQETGAVVTFSLNALHGRHRGQTRAWEGAWNSSNARSFIEYTISKGYPVDSWEFGNELSGHGVGAKVGVRAYARDLLKLKEKLVELYEESNSFPMLLAPGGFYEQHWYGHVLDYAGPNVISGMTHHIYNLGAGNDPHLIDRILNRKKLVWAETTFRNIQLTIKRHGPSSRPWVSEAGGAYNSGGDNVSNTFVDSFWYVDQLGMAAKYGTKVYCRQTLVGGNYGLLDTASFVPNPDYYSALLWHRLMGKTVLLVENNASPSLRIYAHCAKQRGGISMVFMNFNSTTQFNIDVVNDLNAFPIRRGEIHANASFANGLQRTFSWIGKGAAYGTSWREEYHLTSKGGNYRSRTMLLNGSPLKLKDSGDIPEMNPIPAAPNSPISVTSLSIAFVVIPYFEASACV